MTNRRTDAVYFTLLLVVAMTGFLAANWPTEEDDSLPMPDFSPPSLYLTLDIPFDLPFAFVKFESLEPPVLELSNDIETALSEVRLALLKSSRLREIRSTSKPRQIGAVDLASID